MSNQKRKVRNCCTTTREKTEIQYKWQVSDFQALCSRERYKNGHYLYSPPFSDADDKFHWRIRLIPYGRDDDRDFISVYLICLDADKRVICSDFKLKVELVSNVGSSVVYSESRKYHRTFPASNGDTGYGTSNFVERQVICDLLNQTPTSTLQVSCTIMAWYPDSKINMAVDWSSRLGLKAGKRKENKWTTTALWQINDFNSYGPSDALPSQAFTADAIVKWTPILLVQNSEELTLCFPSDIKKQYQSRTFFGKFRVMVLDCDNREIRQFSFHWQLPDCSVFSPLQKQFLVKRESLEKNILKVYCELSSCEVTESPRKNPKCSAFAGDPDGDLILRCDSEMEFCVSRCHLINSCGYFRVLFDNEEHFQSPQPREAHGKQCVHVNFIPAAYVEALLEFIYMGYTNMIKSSPQDLLWVSDYFQCNELCEECQIELIGRLSKRKMYDLAKLCDSRDWDVSLLRDCTINYLADYAGKVDCTPKWQEFARNHRKIALEILRKSKQRYSLKDLQWLVD